VQRPPIDSRAAGTAEAGAPEPAAPEPAAPLSLRDADVAAAFVRELFLHVLRQPEPPPAQLEAWARRARASGDALAVFRAFVATPAAEAALAAHLDSATRWPAGHFYSPLPRRSELEADRARLLAPRALAGIDLNEAGQLAFLGRLAPHLSTLPFGDAARPGLRYRYDNRSYGPGDAAVYWAILHAETPRRILEVGSGFSSALALDAIEWSGLDCLCTFVDPYPDLAREVTDPLPPGHRIVPARIQDVGLAELARLDAGDILFIDSSHVLKTGSDVHFELTEMLPRVPPGVLVHVHDVFTNLEYPAEWIFERAHGWNEIYALHAFLLFNGAFRIEYFNHHMATRHRERVAAAAGPAWERIRRNPGGGLWLRRV
jgi:hypothetical protein